MGTDPYANLTDVEVLDRARQALIAAAALPPGMERQLKWMVFDAAKAELDLRVARCILAAMELPE